MTNTSYNVNDIIKAQYWELWNEDKITIEQKFFLELENILWKENVIIRNWEIEIKWEKKSSNFEYYLLMRFHKKYTYQDTKFLRGKHCFSLLIRENDLEFKCFFLFLL